MSLLGVWGLGRGGGVGLAADGAINLSLPLSPGFAGGNPLIETHSSLGTQSFVCFDWPLDA